MNKNSPFQIEITVRGYELDAFNHVNHAVYLQYFEHARWMAFKELGLDALSEAGLAFVVRRAAVDYFEPARLFDELYVRLWIERAGTTSLTFGQDLVRKNDQQVLALAEIVAVCIGANGRPHPLPQQWKQAS
ncbi:MAG: acyl-CoA thioesterase [Bradymonadaceae bacterium]|nr:acyl-CoA thioesterase [Lujinxingiaceae bacterium]